MTENKIITFDGNTLQVQTRKYRNNRTAIELIDTVDHMLYMVATVNIPTSDIAKDEVIIKNYSENEGIYDVLVKAGVISESIGQIHAGFANALICKLL